MHSERGPTAERFALGTSRNGAGPVTPHERLGTRRTLIVGRGNTVRSSSIRRAGPTTDAFARGQGIGAAETPTNGELPEQDEQRRKADLTAETTKGFSGF